MFFQPKDIKRVSLTYSMDSEFTVGLVENISQQNANEVWIDPTPWDKINILHIVHSKISNRFII